MGIRIVLEKDKYFGRCNKCNSRCLPDKYLGCFLVCPECNPEEIDFNHETAIFFLEDKFVDDCGTIRPKEAHKLTYTENLAINTLVLEWDYDYSDETARA